MHNSLDRFSCQHYGIAAGGSTRGNTVRLAPRFLVLRAGPYGQERPRHTSRGDFSGCGEG